MYKIILQTKDFAGEFIEDEIKILTNQKIDYINDEFFSKNFKTTEELNEFVHKIAFQSRTVDRIYLEICNTKTKKISQETLTIFENKNLTFEIDSKTKKFDKKTTEIEFGNLIKENLNLEVNLKNYDLSFKIIDIEKETLCLLDLIGFDLSKREYKLNSDSMSINSSVSNYLFSLMNLDEEEEPFSIIDISANLGDLIIEAAIFNPRQNLNIRHKTKFPIYKLLKKLIPTPKTEDTKNKILAVVQNNNTFKNLRENVNYSGQRIKISQFEFDWLDVKFQAQEIDYVISQIPTFDTEKESLDYQDEFFYQAEFIVERLIGVVSKKPISKKPLEKYKLEIQEQEEIFVGEQKYYIYVILPIGEPEEKEEKK